MVCIGQFLLAVFRTSVLICRATRPPQLAGSPAKMIQVFILCTPRILKGRDSVLASKC